MKIGNRLIGDGNPIFIIAEIGSNHNGNMGQAKKLIDAAVESGADAAKFQSLKYDELYVPKKDSEMEQLFRQIELKEEWLEELSSYCDKKNIIFFSAPTYPKAVDLLENLNVKLHKIASPQTATYPQLIEKVAKLDKPIIMSTGYCTFEEIDRARKIVNKVGNDKIALLHCVSEYPMDPKDANLEFIRTLKSAYKIPVGFSDHSLKWDITIAAVALGANIIEKHITLSRDQSGPDHFFALEPHEFKNMVRNIRTVENSIGSGTKLEITEKESDFLAELKMRAIAVKNISRKTKLNTETDVHFKRSHDGIDAWDIYKATEIIAKKDIKKDEAITYDSVDVLR